ncbi:MAG: hypothetical protein VX768_14500 [Planctomycetota bacterium]|nr:hypothetical protein [Planctomycetota bacterium]
MNVEKNGQTPQSPNENDEQVNQEQASNEVAYNERGNASAGDKLAGNENGNENAGNENAGDKRDRNQYTSNHDMDAPPLKEDDITLTALALGEVNDPGEIQRLEKLLETDDNRKREHESTRQLAALIRDSVENDLPLAPGSIHDVVLAELESNSTKTSNNGNCSDTGNNSNNGNSEADLGRSIDGAAQQDASVESDTGMHVQPARVPVWPQQAKIMASATALSLLVVCTLAIWKPWEERQGVPERVAAFDGEASRGRLPTSAGTGNSMNASSPDNWDKEDTEVAEEPDNRPVEKETWPGKKPGPDSEMFPPEHNPGLEKRKLAAENERPLDGNVESKESRTRDEAASAPRSRSGFQAGGGSGADDFSAPKFAGAKPGGAKFDGAKFDGAKFDGAMDDEMEGQRLADVNRSRDGQLEKGSSNRSDRMRAAKPNAKAGADRSANDTKRNFSGGFNGQIDQPFGSKKEGQQSLKAKAQQGRLAENAPLIGQGGMAGESSGNLLRKKTAMKGFLSGAQPGGGSGKGAPSRPAPSPPAPSPPAPSRPKPARPAKVQPGLSPAASANPGS